MKHDLEVEIYLDLGLEFELGLDLDLRLELYLDLEFLVEFKGLEIYLEFSDLDLECS